MDSDVRAQVTVLASLDPATDVDDLAGWGGGLGSLRVIGVGEATHGTHEFFTLRHRLLEYLTRKHGFDVLALEASAEGCRVLDAYVTAGGGNPVRALRQLGYWTWNTEEMLAVLEWLRAHNAEIPPRKAVRIVGVDPTNERRTTAARDRAMAKNVLDLLADDQTRVIFWAHNGHIGTGGVTARAPASGAYLRKELGTGYYPLALTFHHGSFEALRLARRGPRGPEKFTVGEPPRRSVEYTLGRIVDGDYLLDLRHATDVPALRAWAFSAHPMRSHGSIAIAHWLNPNPTAQVVPASEFDAIALVRRTGRAQPIRSKTSRAL